MKITMKELKQIIKEELESCKDEFNNCMTLWGGEKGGDNKVGCLDDFEKCEDTGRTKSQEKQFQKKLANFQKWTVLTNKLGEDIKKLIKAYDHWKTAAFFAASAAESRHGHWDEVEGFEQEANDVLKTIKDKISNLSDQDKIMVKKALRKHGIRIK